MRSPIWLRLISDVPPAIDIPRCIEREAAAERTGAIEEGTRRAR